MMGPNGNAAFRAQMGPNGSSGQILNKCQGFHEDPLHIVIRVRKRDP